MWNSPSDVASLCSEYVEKGLIGVGEFGEAEAALAVVVVDESERLCCSTDACIMVITLNEMQISKMNWIRVIHSRGEVWV